MDKEKHEKLLEQQRAYRRKKTHALDQIEEQGLGLDLTMQEKNQWMDVKIPADLRNRIIKYNRIATIVHELSYTADVNIPRLINAFDDKPPKGTLGRLSELLVKVDLLDLDSVDWAITAAANKTDWVNWCNAVHIAYMACIGYAAHLDAFGNFEYTSNRSENSGDVSIASSTPNGEATQQLSQAEPARKKEAVAGEALTIILEKYQALNIRLLELEAQYKDLERRLASLEGLK